MTPSGEELAARARAWITGDPDPATREELEQVLERGDLLELESRLTPLAFGTAGLRGQVGAGSGRMNLAVVIRAAHAIAQHVVGSPALAAKPRVVGVDARPASRGFCAAKAGVRRAAGR
jgi:phosphomannomutase